MYEKLDKLREEVRRAEKRKKYADEKFNTLQEKLREAESMQILADVGAMHLTFPWRHPASFRRSTRMAA